VSEVFPRHWSQPVGSEIGLALALSLAFGVLLI
jgi:hypothetical protein